VSFTTLGTLSCPDTAGTPFSMGVDRNTTAWVLYSDGKIFNVDINNGLKCTATSFSGGGQGTKMVNFGMGFSTDTVGGSTDTLYIAGGAADTGNGLRSSSTFDTLDTSSMAAASLGSVNGEPELTGNSNAELWGWFPSLTGTAKIEKIDKASGSALVTYEESALGDGSEPTAWAFAFYGGDYFVFLATEDSTTTNVSQINGSNGSVIGTASTNTTIVGAGVSTCAPTVID
jgi:hypothetical protein